MIGLADVMNSFFDKQTVHKRVYGHGLFFKSDLKEFRGR